MICEKCNIECPFIIKSQCPIKTLYERVEMMQKAVKMINELPEGGLLVVDKDKINVN